MANQRFEPTGMRSAADRERRCASDSSARRWAAPMPPGYSMPADTLASVLDSAVVATHRTGTEICGLLVTEDGSSLKPLRLRNKARRPGSWEFYVGDVRTAVAQATRDGHEVVGTFHSHPVGTVVPGPSDIANAVDDSLMLIIDCTAKRHALWHIQSGEAQPLRLLARLTEPQPTRAAKPNGKRRRRVAARVAERRRD